MGLTSVCVKMMEQVILEVISRHIKEKKEMRSSEGEVTKASHAWPTS